MAFSVILTLFGALRDQISVILTFPGYRYMGMQFRKSCLERRMPSFKSVFDMFRFLYVLCFSSFPTDRSKAVLL